MRRFGIKILILCAASALASCTKFDSSALESRIDAANEKLSALETLAVQLGKDMSGLATILEESAAGNLITGCVVSPDGTYCITFSDGRTITISDGMDGMDGTDGKDSTVDGHTPQLSIKIDHTGRYCWTLDGEFITDSEGNHIYVSLSANQGTDGVVPILRVVDGMWQVSYTGGEVWIDLYRTNVGNPYLFKSVEADGAVVNFTLADGSVFSLYRLVDPKLTISGWEGVPVVPNRSIELEYAVEGATPYTRVSAVANHGLSASVTAGATLGSGTLAISMPSTLTDGDVLVSADNGYGRVSMKKISFEAGTVTVCDIEPVDGMDNFIW